MIKTLLHNIFQIIGYILIILVLWQILVRIGRRLFHFPAPAFIGPFLDSDYRRRIQPPMDLIQRSGINPGQRVLEIGCGSGAYTTFVARAVGPAGVVEALDIQPVMLAQLVKKLNQPENRDIQNVQTHQASASDLPFDDASIDLVYLITVLPEIPDQPRTLEEINRVLKPGGILAVSEFLPDPDYPLSSTTARRGENAGFELEGIFGNFWTYTVRFRKKVV